MKIHLFAIAVAFTVIVTVFVNSFVVSYNIDRLTEAIETAPDDASDSEIYNEIFEDYLRREKYLALSISHSDLHAIEDSLAELIGAVAAGDDDTLIIAKSRVIRALSHIKRLAGVNIDSIF